MASFNKVILIGHMVADPELKTTQSGISVCSFSIGVSRRFVKDSESQQTDFINIVAWRQQAEFVTKYFRKGMAILICGSLQTRSWTDQNGQKRYATDVVADEISFVEKKGSNSDSFGNSEPTYYGNASSQNQDSEKASASAPNFEDASTEDDLPF